MTSAVLRMSSCSFGTWGWSSWRANQWLAVGGSLRLITNYVRPRQPDPRIAPRALASVRECALASGILFLLCDSGVGRSDGRVGELQWTALLYTNSSLKSAAPRPRLPKPSKGSHRLRLNLPSRTG